MACETKLERNMGRGWVRAKAGLALALIIPTLANSPLQASGAGLVPFAGETLQEFEARKKGTTFRKPGVELGGTVTVLADRRGHFLVEPVVDGQRIRMLVDTGASAVALAYEDAMNAGIRVAPSDFTVAVNTANGVTQAAPVRIAEIQIGDITVRGVEAFVARPGALKVSLLGMTFLKRLGGFEIAQGRLTLR
jgi:aspartyl protease family protein